MSKDQTRLKTLAANVARLSNLLTRERETLPSAYLRDKDLREAYIHYYVPANLYKIHVPLKELSLHSRGTLRKDRLRIIDLGSGPGTAILGVMDFFSSQEEKPFLEFIAVDPVSENLMDAERLFQSFRKEVSANATLLTVKSSTGRTKSLPAGLFDMIILSNVLSEVFHPDPERIEKRVKLLTALIKRSLASDGSCIIIEPALRETSRELLEVRDGLIGEGLHIYAPCLMNDPCPALINPKDWCHEDVPWEPPAIVREVDKLTGLRKDSLKFSYLIIRKDTLSLSNICNSNPFRVVSEPLISKGKFEYYICGSVGRRLAVRLDKDESNLNEPFSRLKRGNIVSFQGLIDEGKRLKAGKRTHVNVAMASPFFTKSSNFTTMPLHGTDS